MPMPSKTVIVQCPHCHCDVSARPSELRGRDYMFCSSAHYRAHRLAQKERKACERCGTSYIPPQASKDRSRFCNRECFDAHQRETRYLVRSCVRCSGEFKVRASSPNKHCPECSAAAGGKPGRLPNPELMANLTCNYCGVEFQRHKSMIVNNRSGRYFCSKACADDAGRRPRAVRICVQCGNDFNNGTGNDKKVKFCNTECYKLWQNEHRKELNCRNCEAFFFVPASSIKQFCTKSCAATFRKSQEHSEQVLQSGYVKVYAPKSSESDKTGWGAKHRVEMAKLLGRALLPGESVHHLNGDRADNSIDGPLRIKDGKWRSGNLELWSKYQPAGQRVEDQVKAARALLERYAPDLLNA
jgi:YHS domain-containing protein